LTHNHPSGRSFSIEDIKLAIAWNLKGIRACGKQYRYYLNLPTDGWTWELWEDIIEPLLEKVEEEVFNELIRLLIKGQLTIKDIEFRYWHEVWNRIAEEVGLDYGCEEWNND